MRILLISVALLFLSLPLKAETPIQIFMAGDSTMSIKPPGAFPETGWGMPFSHFFDDTVSVDNRAMNGRSTRTFISEGRWQSIIKALRPDDIVFIQFGHNDQSESKPDRYTPKDQYSKNLTGFITDVRAQQAEPILLSPITRRYFDSNGSIRKTHTGYAEAVRQVAAATGVVFIDLEAITRDYFSQLGNENSKLRFMHLAADVHPNYPQGVTDDTHLNELGAREVAQMVLAELKKSRHRLASRLHPPRYP